MSLNLFVRVARFLLNPTSQRLHLALPLAVGLIIVACGGGDPDVPIAPPLGEGGGAAVGNGNGQGGGAADSSGGRGGGISIDPPPACEPKTCEELEKNCGKVPDGCGEALDCGECEDGMTCGLVAPNVCATQDDIDELCKPISKDEACEDKECGVEGDGCGGTYECGECEDGEGCGVETPFQCSTIVTGTDDDCPAKIEDCASVGAQCGLIGNGCGGTIDCDEETGGCGTGELCGLGGPQQCGTAPVCEPLDAVEACAGKCGIVSNGCGVDVDGGIIDCSALYPCPNGQTCGGGGVANQCGTSTTSCTPQTQDVACGDRECGSVGNGCDSSYACGACKTGEVCVEGGCEVPACTIVSKATACAGKTCGTVGNGCGGTYNCGTCATGQQCGAQTAFACGVPTSTCVPMTRAQACAGKECGVAYDGCGTAAANRFNCGSSNGACPSGQFCGLKQPFQCDAPTVPTCTPTATTCAALGWACGKAVNNCGTVIDCALEGRICGSLETCVGGVSGPTTCQGPTGGACPLCSAVPSCAGQSLTRLSGRVITPGRTDSNTANQVGVPNAVVYILRTNNLADLPAISTGIPSGTNGESCDRCDQLDLGPVLASATTDANGNYTLSGNIPVGVEFTLVVKVGKFRRAQRYTVPANAACTTVNLPTAAATNPTRLARTMSDGLAVNIPRIAVTTGRIDAMECVFEKMGIAASEFGNGSATMTGARVHLYRGGPANDPAGAFIDGNTPHDAALYTDAARMRTYDMVVADCEGTDWDDGFDQPGAANVRDYVNRGGRLFASHLSFSWLHGNGTQAYAAGTRFATGLGPAATWQTSAVSGLSLGTGIVSRGRPRASPRIENFAAWMVREGIVTAPAYTFNITDPRSQATALGTSAEEFVHCNGGDCTGNSARTQQFSFNTPYAAPTASACGRVAYSGFHVAATGGGTSPFADSDFPEDCGVTLTGQEKVLLYMLFDLGACVGNPPTPPSCTPRACPGAPSCGQLPDGCGGTLNCGCPSGQTCAANNQCVAISCVPTTCAAQGIVCSSISDGCGKILECPCSVCTPKTKAQACAGVTCGTASDGCSNVHTCSTCPPACVPLTACPSGSDCGIISDGCNGTLNCGTCESGKVCGGAGTPNRCDTPMCPKLTCEDLDATCGLIGDGCGGSADCGTCAPGQICKTTNGVQSCEGCQPRKCADVEAECGLIGDGCGATVDCGPCPTGSVCGAIEPNKCGGGSCKPQTCEAAGAECGLIGDGCGDKLDCGECPPGEVCGLESPFKCSPPPPCEPKTCDELGAECGLISDGCTDLLDCGVCPTGSTCGLVESNTCAKVK